MKRKQAGINARSSSTANFEMVDKTNKNYRFSESASSDESFDLECQIQTCDMRSATFASDLGKALKDIGFAVLVGHGIDKTLFEEVEKATRTLFEETTVEERMAFSASRPKGHSVNQGYFPIKHTAAIHPDLVEGWVFTRRAFKIPDRNGPHADLNYSPTPPVPGAGANAKGEFFPSASHVEEVITRYTKAMEPLIPKIMKAMISALMIHHVERNGSSSSGDSKRGYDFVSLSELPADTQDWIANRNVIFAADEPSRKWKCRNLMVNPNEFSVSNWEIEALIFDFDQTLASVHVWHKCAALVEEQTPKAHYREVRKWSDGKIIEEVFGGKERALRLQQFLVALKAKGHKLFVCSRGFCPVIEHLLGRLLGQDPSSVFERVFGNAPKDPDNSLPSGGKRQVIERLREEILTGDKRSFVFVDDDLQREVLPVALSFAAQVRSGNALVIHVHPPEEGESGGIPLGLMDQIQRNLLLPRELLLPPAGDGASSQSQSQSQSQSRVVGDFVGALMPPSLPPSWALRLNYYPGIEHDGADDQSGAGRLLGHEDVTMFTLLPAPREEGLQVLNRRNSKWLPMHLQPGYSHPDGAIVLNTGDYMQRVSNDVFPSTTHRVSKPKSAEAKARTRVSFPINVYCWPQQTLRVLPFLANPNPKYTPIKALEFHTRITEKYYGRGYAEQEGERDQTKDSPKSISLR